MIPADYHDFFLGAVTMGAALVGLLFVAISGGTVVGLAASGQATADHRRAPAPSRST
jgi:hypothetical protein